MGVVERVQIINKVKKLASAIMPKMVRSNNYGYYK